MDGLQPLVNIALLDKRSEGPSDGGFIVVAHGQVWTVPLAQNAQPFEFLSL